MTLSELCAAFGDITIKTKFMVYRTLDDYHWETPFWTCYERDELPADVLDRQIEAFATVTPGYYNTIAVALKEV